MLARLQKLLTVGVFCSALAWGLLLWQAGHRIWAIVGAALIVFGYALILALEFVLLWWFHGDDPTPRANGRQLLRAWWGEVLSTPCVFCWRQPFRSNRWPDRLPADARGQRGVLLVHGFVCNRGIWNPWLERLTRADVPTVAVNLEPVFGSMDEMVPIIEDAVRRLEQCTGVAPVVVAHSMGGLVLRHWWNASDGHDRIHHAITIGTPHQGTWLARLGRAASARQMRQQSEWLLAMVAKEQASRATKFTCFYSHCDNIVFPAATATLPGADNRHLAGVAHVHMVEREEPWHALQQWLTPSPQVEQQRIRR